MFFSRHPMLLNMVAFRKTSFPWHAGKRVDVCLSTQHIISMQCISTVMNASLPLGSVLVPPRAHALPFAEVLFVAYGAHVSNPLIGDGRGPGGATSGRICGVQLFSVFAAAGLAQRQICHLPPSHALSHPANLLIMLRASHPHLLVRGGWHVFLPPATIRALRGPGGRLPGPCWCHTHKDREIRQEKIYHLNNTKKHLV